ncbi:MAG: hypothetical protein ACOCVF_01855 [bacterium]
MENNIKTLLDLKNNGTQITFKFLNKNFPDVLKEIVNYTKDLDIPFNQKLYHYINQLKTIPQCLNCNKPVRFSYKNGAGYNKYCSLVCSNKSPITKNKIKQANLNKYGVECTLSLKNVQDKSKRTKKEKYGDENYRNVEQSKKTKIIRYGKYFNNIDKAKQTKKEKYDNENYNNRSQSKITKLKKYGDENYNNRKKAIKTHLDKYGYYYNNREKAKQTNKLKYGVDFFSQTNQFKKNMRYSHNSKTIDVWSKFLSINHKDLIINENNFIINNYCKKHKTFTIDNKNFYNRITNNIPLCTQCYPINSLVSINEKKLFDEIKKIYPYDIIENDRKQLNGYEIDIYIPFKKIGIEYNGLYYHSEKFKNKKYHFNKTNLAINKNIFLFQIYEDEWIFKKNIILSMLQHQLGQTPNKIYGRKCEIRETSNQESKVFLNNNHIQGNTKSKIKIGLYYNDKLVSLMTFEKTRNSISKTENSYTLNRFCNIINTSVIGSANKLLSFFIKKYLPNEIITFADRRYSMGNLYETLGFTPLKIIDESYYVFNKHENIRYHRFNFRKSKLIELGGDPNKSESEILQDLNYLKIYDAGKIKYRLVL